MKRVLYSISISLILLLCIQLIPSFEKPPLPPDEPPSPERQVAWEAIAPRLAEANKASAQACSKACQRVSDFFEERQGRTKPFADSVFSLSSKWAFLKSSIPFGDGDGHRKYLRDSFEAAVFSQKELEELLKSIIEEFIKAVEGIENDLLVKIRADLPDSIVDDPAFTTNAAFHEEYDRALKEVATLMVKDLKVQVGREVVTWVSADVATMITLSLTASLAERLGISAGILGTGAVSGVTTLGIAIAAGFIIDALLDWVLHAMGYDPAAAVEKQVKNSLEDFEGLLLYGDNYQAPLLSLFDRDDEPLRWYPKKPGDKPCPGLFIELVHVAEKREQLRTEALKKLILKGGK